MVRSNDDAKSCVASPLWFFVPASDQQRDMIALGGPDGEKGYPFFTAKHSAEQFLEESQLTDYKLAVAINPVTLLPLLDTLQANRFTHVLIDHTSNEGTSIAISDLRQQLRASE